MNMVFNGILYSNENGQIIAACNSWVALTSTIVNKRTKYFDSTDGRYKPSMVS